MTVGSIKASQFPRETSIPQAIVGDERRTLSDTPPAPALSVTVVIPTYGRTAPLVRLLQSIAAQRTAPAAVVVVDQNPDGFLDEALDEVPLPRLFRIRLPEPNTAAARNAGFLLAETSHVAFIDDDETLDPRFFERAFETLAARPEIRCLWPVVLSGEDLEKARAGARRHMRGPAIPGTTLFEVTRTGAGGVIFESAYFRASGGYDPLLFAFGGMSEDWELSARMQRRGMKMWCDEALVIRHDDHQAGGCGTRSLPYLVVRERLMRACFFRYRAEAGPPFRLPLRSLLPLLALSLGSSLGRPDARPELLLHPLRHLRLLRKVARESRQFLLDRGAAYSRPGGADHLAP